jgi:hypothetical protein
VRTVVPTGKLEGRTPGASLVGMWGKQSTFEVAAAIAAVLLALSLGSASPAAADDPTPTPAPADTSSAEEIADMVMDAIGQDVTAPTTSVVVAPAQ